MAKKKHPFHCENCEAECIIYKKGKNHRVLVCPNCGVLATNGKGTAGKIIKKIGKGALRSIPFVGDIGAELLTKETSPSPASKSPTIRRNNTQSLEKIKYAIGGK